MIKTTTALACVLFFLCGDQANAAVTFDWATVGNPGNAPDQNRGHGQFGAVPNTYRISKYEVTNDQYTEFLNAVDPAGANPNSVYMMFMGSDRRGGITFNAGAASGSKYSTKTNMGNKPVNFVSFFDSMRFTNWLENGQPTGGSGTESGVYTIGNGINETRNPTATYFIPSENEWYKAAYYQPAAQGGDYWLYPTASNTVPNVATADAIGDISNPGPNVANYALGADWNGRVGNVTTVGSAGPLSASFYGTFDQGGNVWEWNDAALGSSRGLRGGYWSGFAFLLAAFDRSYDLPTTGSGSLGFRVASVPEPSPIGDFDGNGVLDTGDIDMLCGPVDLSHDVTGDGLVTQEDLVYWVRDLANTYFGDADLNGEFDSGDLVQVFVAGKYERDEAASWSKGDWNCDCVSNSSDMVTAFVDGGYEKGPRTVVVAVPEPRVWVLLVTGLLPWLPVRRAFRVV